MLVGLPYETNGLALRSYEKTGRLKIVFLCANSALRRVKPEPTVHLTHFRNGQVACELRTTGNAMLLVARKSSFHGRLPQLIQKELVLSGQILNLNSCRPALSV